MGFLAVCTALYPYTPQGEGELAIEEGELLYILEKSNEDDWWKAKKKAPNDGDEEPEGLIPNNYVEETQPTHTAKALYEYSRQTDEELSFSEEAVLAVYDNKSDPDWTLAGLNGEFGFVPANYIEITGDAEEQSVASPPLPARHAQQQEQDQEEDEDEEQDAPRATAQPSAASSGPAAALAGIMHGRTASVETATNPTLPPRHAEITPDASDDEPPPPALPQRPANEHPASPPPTQYTSPRSPVSPGVAESPPHNRIAHQRSAESSQGRANAGGFHLYNISEMVSAMGKSKKLPTTLGLNLATGIIMIAPEKSRDGPTQEWTADKLTHYSIEGKHVFVELVKPSKSIDFHAGAKDTAQEIVAGLGEIAGASRAEGLREVLAAAGSGTGQKRGKMVYDFMSQGDDEVTVAADDDVIVLDDTKSDEWWMVKRLKNGKEGMVPSSYVEVTGTVAAPAAPASTSGLNAGRSVVEQNRLEEERLAKEALKKGGSEVGPGYKLPARGSSLTTGDGNKESSQRNKESKHGRTSSTQKHKPNLARVRTWTDRSGTFKVEAQFLGLKDGKLHLHKLNGVKIAVPIGKMAVDDLEYVENVTGVSLDDDKPLAEVKRRSTQAARDRRKGGDDGRAGASIESPKPPPKDENEYDWFDFFLKAGVSPYQCERYASNFHKDQMDENVLAEVTASTLRTLGLKEGDILRVMKYLDTKYGRTGAADEASAGLFSGPGGALRNNTRKGRPAPAVESKDVVDEGAFRPKENGGAPEKSRDPTAPPVPKKDGFDDDAWDVKPSRKESASQPSANANAPASPQPPSTAGSQQQAQLSGNLLDLSLLSPPLQPTPAPQNKPPQQPQPEFPPQPAPQQQQPQQVQSQPTGANPQFFSQLGPAQNQQVQNQPQQVGPPRQRPQAPPTTQQNSMLPPPPTRPLSAPQTQNQNNLVGVAPLQPQLTGYQPQHTIALPGQSLNELNQQRFQQQQQQQFNQQQQQQFPQQQQQQPLQPQQTGYIPQSQFGTAMLMQQQTGIPLPYGGANPYVNGQMSSSPFADPRTQQLQPQMTGYQSLPSLQPQATGLNSMLPQALQPQPTGVMTNGFAPPPVPPIPQQQQPTGLAPLQPQKTGPAPPVRFGTNPANKLVPQPTGRRANLSAATPSNPFGLQ